MKLFNLMILSSLSTSLLLGATATLSQKAKQNGLEAFPTTKEAIIKRIDPNHTITNEKLSLGKILFFEPRLSKSGLISCNTCHNLGMGGVDGVSAAIGHKWTANPHHLNSPTVYNAVLADAQFWDGRSPTLEDQAQGPMQALPEMASPKALVEARINSMPQYVNAFKTAYGKDVNITFELITATIGIFERVLITPAPFDSFLNGNEKALSKEEKEGLSLFIDKGCTSCHNGLALGGKMQPFAITGKYKYASIGDFKGDKNGLIKTPTLRNITQTAPYFHNGAIWTLQEAIQEMGRIQLGLKITDEEAQKIAIFFNSLQGQKPPMAYPQLPTSTKITPKPDMN